MGRSYDISITDLAMAFDAFALILTMLALGMVFARLKFFPGLP